MENANGMLNQKTCGDNTSKFLPFPPFSPDVESRGENVANHHQRCSSEIFLVEEQPSWLDDLLNDSEALFPKAHHRRSASDSYAYLGSESDFVNAFFGPQNVVSNKDVGSTSVEAKGHSGPQKYNQESEEAVAVEQNSREETSSRNLEGSADKAGGSQVKASGVKTDSKRSKQNNAHRSRVRKLQYITHLERTLQMLKAEGSEVSAELEFLEQQNIILTMENRALRQRLESISQEHIIKNWEQGMLERETWRLQSLYHLQKQQQMQMHHQQQQQHSKQHRMNTSTSMKNKDAGSSKVPVPVPSSVHV